MENKLEIKWYNTIRVKLIAVFIITATLITSLAGYFVYKNIANTQQADLSELASVSASRMAQHLIRPMWDVDVEQVNKLLEVEMQERKIEAIVVRDEDHQTLFAAKERGEDGATKDSVGTIIGDFDKVDRNIISDDGDDIGTVSVFITSKYMHEELSKFLRVLVLTLVVLNLFIFVIMMNVLGRMLVDPLSKLTTVANQISKGQLNKLIDYESNDELGHLTNSFKRMQASVKILVRKIRANSDK